MKFNVGDKVELVNDIGQNIKAQKGAQAIVVSGASEYPYLYSKFKKATMNVKTKDLDEFMWIKWDRYAPNHNEQDNGAYAVFRFKKIVSMSTSCSGCNNKSNNCLKPKQSEKSCSSDCDDCKCDKEPTNNDGRSKCYWCGSPTKSIQSANSVMHVCTNSDCGR